MPGSNIISAAADGANPFSGFHFLPARARDNLKTKPGTLDFDIRRRTFHLGPVANLARIYLLACPLNPQAPPPVDLHAEDVKRADTSMSKTDTNIVIQYLMDILHAKM